MPFFVRRGHVWRALGAVRRAGGRTYEDALGRGERRAEEMAGRSHGMRSWGRWRREHRGRRRCPSCGGKFPPQVPLHRFCSALCRRRAWERRRRQSCGSRASRCERGSLTARLPFSLPRSRMEPRATDLIRDPAAPTWPIAAAALIPRRGNDHGARRGAVGGQAGRRMSHVRSARSPRAVRRKMRRRRGPTR